MSQDSIVVTIGLPHRSLSPNARCHWAVKAKHTKSVRVEAWAACQIAMHENTVRGNWETADVLVKWYAKTERRRDRDNCIAALKPAFDGLVDGGLLIDDEGLTQLPAVILVDRERPRVELHLYNTTGLPQRR